MALSGFVSGERARPLSSSIPVARRLIRLRRAYSAGVAEVIVIVTVGIVLPVGGEVVAVMGKVDDTRLSAAGLTGPFAFLVTPRSGVSSVSILVMPELFDCCFEGSLIVKQFDSDSFDGWRSNLAAAETAAVIVVEGSLLPAIEVVLVTVLIVFSSSWSIEPLESLDVVEAVSKLFIILLKSFSEESVAFFATIENMI